MFIQMSWCCSIHFLLNLKSKDFGEPVIGMGDPAPFKILIFHFFPFGSKEISTCRLQKYPGQSCRLASYLLRVKTMLRSEPICNWAASHDQPLSYNGSKQVIMLQQFWCCGRRETLWVLGGWDWYVENSMMRPSQSRKESILCCLLKEWRAALYIGETQIRVKTTTSWFEYTLRRKCYLEIKKCVLNDRWVVNSTTIFRLM